MAENTAKRRKLGHPKQGPSLQNGFATTAAASALMDATEEIITDARVDYGKDFEGVDEILRQYKDAIESLDPREPVPVRSLNPTGHWQ